MKGENKANRNSHESDKGSFYSLWQGRVLFRNYKPKPHHPFSNMNVKGLTIPVVGLLKQVK